MGEYLGMRLGNGIGNIKEEKERKREEKEDAQEARIPAAALEEYLRDHGKVPGVGYRSIARKYRIDQQQLKDAVTKHDEDLNAGRSI